MACAGKGIESQKVLQAGCDKAFHMAEGNALEPLRDGEAKRSPLKLKSYCTDNKHIVGTREISQLPCGRTGMQSKGEIQAWR